MFKILIILASYVDDFFGGPKRSRAGLNADKVKAELAFRSLIAVGDLTGTKMNSEKCHPPARIMEILGSRFAWCLVFLFLFCGELRR